MTATRIADIIVPEVFNSYVVQRSAELSALVRSGIVVLDPALDVLAQAGGKLINMPFFNDLTGDDEVLSDSGSLTVNKNRNWAGCGSIAHAWKSVGRQ